MVPLRTVKEASAIVNAILPASRIVRVPLAQALGYCHADNARAERNHPPFDRVTHDGMAIASSANNRVFLLESYAAAGQPRATLTRADHAIEVATGAPLPIGCDMVVPYEDFEKDGTQATLHPEVTLNRGHCIHIQGSDAKAGDIILAKGARIGVPEIAVLAGNGMTEVSVYAKPIIGILATGSELVAPGDPIESHQIRRSNDAALAACLHANGFSDVEKDWVADDEDAIRARLAGWLSSKDFILIIGGVSRGSRDYVPGVLQSLKVDAEFHKVAQRPGKPLWFGRNERALVFGLPGNPNSSLTCLVRYVLPALHAISGNASRCVEQLALSEAAAAHEELTLFLPVRRSGGKVSPLRVQNSGDFIAMVGSDGFIELPPQNTYSTGTPVEFYPWGPV